MAADLYLVVVVAAVLASVTLAASTTPAPVPANIQQFLIKYDKAATASLYRATESEWNYNTNLTEHNKIINVAENLRHANFSRTMAAEASALNTVGLDPDTKRKLNKIKDVGTAAQTDQAKLERLTNDIAEMQSIYSKAKVCMDDKATPCVPIPLDPDITHIMETSRDYATLLKAWQGWHDVTGPPMKKTFENYVTLKNEALKMAGFPDAGAYWRNSYDIPTFEDDVMGLWAQLKPLYEQLHGYVRRKLRQHYGADKFPQSGHIPAHLLGNMWAQQWDTVEDIVKPFPNKQSIDVTAEMIKQNYTVDRMFHTADDFFKSLGLKQLPQPFWNMSMLKRPDDGREVVCHASAWDFYNAHDFRIKMCTVITQQDLTTIHHEMGHIQYYMQYMDQPIIYRRGANPGFHEAMGDTMALSVGTPAHLRTIGLLKDTTNDHETDINFLMNMALQKIAFLPFGYLIDQWRWSVFRGDTAPDAYNDKWWDLKCRLQGVSSPVTRPSSAFDPGSKFHVTADVAYIRYFVSFIIQFQFHKAACDKAGHTGPLHQCDIYRNKEAGALIGSMLKLGSSKPWPEAMQLLTGSPNMDARPLVEYFKPLLEFLRKENGNDYGWDPQCPAPAPAQAPAPAPCPHGNGGVRTSGQATRWVFLSAVICACSFIGMMK